MMNPPPLSPTISSLNQPITNSLPATIYATISLIIGLFKKIFNFNHAEQLSATQKQQKLDALDGSIKKLTADIYAFISIITYLEEFAAPHYQRMVHLYASLPADDIEAAKSKIAAAIALNQTAINSLDPDDEDLTSKQQLLTREIGANLNKMQQCSPAQWKFELEMNQKTWQRAYDEAHAHPLANRAIDNQRDQITKLLKEKMMLERA